MRCTVEESEAEEAALALTESRDITRCVQVDLFSIYRASDLFSGFLYGQPMWDPITMQDVDEDYEALVKVYMSEDNFLSEGAIDASIDAIRDLLIWKGSTLHGLFAPLTFHPLVHSELARLLLDFLVYGDCGGHAKTWVENCASECSLVWPGSGSLEQELCGMLLGKAQDERAGRQPPDLMERCRYHVHGEKPCYLDKDQG